MALEPVLKPRDLQNLPAALVEVDEFDLAEEVFAAALEPDQGFEAFAVDEVGFFEVDDEVDDAALLDAVLDRRAELFAGVCGEVAVERDHADAAVFVDFHRHRLFLMRGLMRGLTRRAASSANRSVAASGARSRAAAR